MHLGSDAVEIADALPIERDEPRVAGRTDHKKRENETGCHNNARRYAKKAVKVHDFVAGASIVFR